MKDNYLVFCFHEPYMFREFSVFEVGKTRNYFGDNNWNMDFRFNRLKEKVEANHILELDRISRLLENDSKVRVGLFISGVFLEQMREYFPEVIEKIRNLIETRRVDIFSRSYYNSFAEDYSEEEFSFQRLKFVELVVRLFKVLPVELEDESFEFYFENDNSLQRQAAKKLFSLKEGILATQDDELISSWRRLQDSYNFELLSLRSFSLNGSQKNYSHFESPYEAFISFMNILKSLEFEVNSLLCPDKIYKDSMLDKVEVMEW